jgi:two-component system sensor histidine kinase BaeS
LIRHLLWKLLGVNVLIIGFVVILVWVVIDYLAADYFVALMDQYHISPLSSHRMFLHAVHRYLIWATLAAVVFAVMLNFLLMNRLLGPLTLMTQVTRKIASGEYSVKVPIQSRDEIGQLAISFNRMAESLQKIEQLRKMMMIDVAHELRTPLTNMQGYLEALRDGVIAPTKETFQMLHEETLRLANLVEDILQLAKADAAKATLHKIEGSLTDLIAQALDSFRPQFESKGVEVETHFTEGANKCQYDPPKLLRVINNLLQNAWQYTQPGGKVRIFTQSLPGEIKAVFANTGGEIAEADLPFLFERFYRAEKSRSRDHGGAGIGLAIVKELIAAHNGQVGAEIANEETRIWFSLPL